MVFYCQKNSSAKLYTTNVVFCIKSKLQLLCEDSLTSESGKNKKPKLKETICYEVIFQDTVFFPEGGGQPDDHGIVVPGSRCTRCCKSASTAEVKIKDMEGTSVVSSETVSIDGISQTCEQSNEKQYLENSSDNGHSDSSNELNEHENSNESSALLKDLVGYGGASSESCSACSANVLRVIRRGAEAVHYLDKPLIVGDSVEQRLDWSRRKDHMQQHSAQHLLTALADKMFGFKTTSWAMGAHAGNDSNIINISNIELDTSSVTALQLQQLQDAANAAVAAALPVTVTEYDPNDPDLAKHTRSRGLPADHVGVVRVVSIAGLDRNTCCGTHVATTAQLGGVGVLGTERGKQGKTLLQFVSGDRMVKHLHECHSKLRSLNTLLSCSPSEHCEVVRKIQANAKVADKTSREALRDLAAAEAQLFKMKLAAQSDGSHDSDGDNSKNDNNSDGGGGKNKRVWCHHRRLADMDYLGALVNYCDDESVLKVLSAGEDSGAGLLLVHGPADVVAEVAPRICKALNGRGGGKNRYTAKVNALHNREQAYAIAEEYLAAKQT